MFEWTLVGMIWAAAFVMVAHTIDEAVCCARPLRAQSHRSPDGPMRGQLASRAHRSDEDASQKRAA